MKEDRKVFLEYMYLFLKDMELLHRLHFYQSHGSVGTILLLDRHDAPADTTGHTVHQFLSV